ncbi:hypothetical protein F5Y07DRAFT_395210 [Xylaria sp. FL0933]|nr:hypothetical protein F5Y07DRAFT_395210 [Xylaria sp. FL0933]
MQYNKRAQAAKSAKKAKTYAKVGAVESLGRGGPGEPSGQGISSTYQGLGKVSARVWAKGVWAQSLGKAGRAGEGSAGQRKKKESVGSRTTHPLTPSKSAVGAIQRAHNAPVAAALWVSASRQSADAKSRQDLPRTYQASTGVLACLGGLVAEESQGLGSWPGLPLARSTPARPVPSLLSAPRLHPIRPELLLHPDGNRPIAKSFRLPTAKSNHHNQELQQHLIYIN